LREWLEKWTAATIDTLAVARPGRVDGLRDRTNEVWRPLLAIAELAGDVWAARARRAAVALAAGDENDEPSLGLLLLGDIRAVFERPQLERIATVDLIAYLAGFDESPWGEWWIDSKTGEVNRSGPRRLAQLLHPYGIRSTTVRGPERRGKSYKREDFLDAWERFLPHPRPGVTSVTSVTSGSHKQTDVTDVTDVTHRRGWPESRFCDECTTPERCADELWCQQIPRLTRASEADAEPEPDGDGGGRKEADG
jgi:hypothetical protein